MGKNLLTVHIDYFDDYEDLESYTRNRLFLQIYRCLQWVSYIQSVKHEVSVWMYKSEVEICDVYSFLKSSTVINL